MKKLWQTCEKILGIYRWHPKIALRYLPVVKEIKKTFPSQCDILEIGSGGLGIAPYIKQKVTGLDTEFNPPIYQLLLPVKGYAQNIPFNDKSYAVVICLDVLEHIPSNDRAKIISECLRVANTLVCIGVPCGELAQKQDEEISANYKKRYSQVFTYLSEHLRNKLPAKEEIFNILKNEATKLGLHVDIKVTGNINLKLRKWLMKGWISDNWLINAFFRKILLLFIPLLRNMNAEPVYRQLFYIKINHV